MVVELYHIKGFGRATTMAAVHSALRTVFRDQDRCGYLVSGEFRGEDEPGLTILVSPTATEREGADLKGSTLKVMRPGPDSGPGSAILFFFFITLKPSVD